MYSLQGICQENINVSNTKSIPINNSKVIFEKGLKQNSFNPLKDSPPNTFLLNLNKRYEKYYYTKSFVTNDDQVDIK